MDSIHEGNKSLVFENHHETFCKQIFNFFKTNIFVNVTLVCKEEFIKAHQIILSASSPFFEKILTVRADPNPTVIFPDISKSEMLLALEYMYNGHVSLPNSQVSSFLATAKKLQLRGLNYEEIDNLQNTVGNNVEGNNFTLDLSPILTETLNAPVGTKDQIDSKANLDTGRTNGERPVWLMKDSVEQDDEIITGRSKKVINPFARKKRNVSDSDSTVFDDDGTPGPSKNKKGSSAPANVDSDVEFVDNDSSVVVIMDSQVRTETPEVNNLVRKYGKRRDRTNSRFNQLDYTSDESDLVTPKSKKTRKNIISDHSEEDSDTTPNVSVNPVALKKRNNRLNRSESPVLSSSGVSKSNEPVQGTSKRDGASVPSKTPRELPEGYTRTSYKNLRFFCVVCKRNRSHIRQHIKKHKSESGRIKFTCKTCHRKFDCKQILNMHKCEPQKNVVDKVLQK